MNSLQLAHVDAIKLITSEQQHHALCYRSIHLLSTCSDALTAQLKPLTFSMTTYEKQKLAEGLEFILHTVESGQSEIAAGFPLVNRRTIIVLADIIENLVESTIGLCLLHLDPTLQSLREVTSFKKITTTERDLKLAVRAWESKLFAKNPLRTQRFHHMILAFFPAFIRPSNFQLLDELIQKRNELSHDLIKIDDQRREALSDAWSLKQVDDAFKVAIDFLLAIMTAIPNDLSSPISMSGLSSSAVER